ncbi:MAG: hypothetical protein DLM61_20030 [Pseudonocardiales bacterium]|nr:hypothetical protein [Pseudonocardiales bacterium]PZS25406.1 MAG: hypothetical protein DLM61_20030 [Pseudonocardiales bacterium]
MSVWVWFVIAGLAAAGGGVLLAIDGGQQSAHQRERRRWAALRGWRFVLSDPVLADRWRHGVMARGGAGLAKDLVIGSLFTPLGRRAVQIFDHEQGGQISSVVVAVQRRVHAADLVAELWVPDQPLPQDPGLRTMGSVGDRVALVNEPDRVGPLTSSEFVLAANALGGDIPVAWVEQDWVLAAAPCSSTPSRLERLLRVLDEIADLLDAADLGKTAEPTELADFFRPGQ